jgi:ferric-dicitrate binding protein FerR (iron transport regulator)
MVAGMAAAIALLIVAIWWVSGGSFGAPPMAETQAGEQKEVQLPDGSAVTLNALSSLRYTPADWSNGRKVTLEGEAYFKAKKGKTFTVATEQGSVEVVGTVFNVYARGNELEVKCSEGKVQVINPDASERALLKAGEQISVVNGRMQKRQGLEFQPKWFKGESTFRSEPLEKVLGEVERQFGVVVLADSIEGRSYTGKFLHKDLNQALKMVCVPMKLKYTVSNDTVFIQ